MNKLFFLLSIIVCFAFSGDVGKICLHMESKKLYKGKVMIIKADVYYKIDGNMTIHYTYPQDYILLTNTKGEVKVYFPVQNQIFLQQNQTFSSENDVLYSFLSQRVSDMRLKESGFSLQNSKYEEGLTITTWLPPIYLTDQISKVEMAHENYLPVYTAIFNVKSKYSKKIYYSDYLPVDQYFLPTKITEIEYLANGDSIISRKIYSDIKTGAQATSPYFNYAIPANAKLMKLNDSKKKN